MDGSSTAISLETFLGYGTTLVNWLATAVMNLINTLMGNPVTSCFLILGLVSFVFVTYRTLTRR